MPEILRPQTLQRELQEIRSRLARMEAAERVGLNRMRWCWNVDSNSVTTFDAWTSGPPAATWEDDQGATGAGYGTLEAELGTLNIVQMSAVLASVGGSTYRCTTVSVGFALDGVDPDLNAVPTHARTHISYIGISTPLQAHLSFTVPLLLPAAGVHTLQARALCETSFPSGDAPVVAAVTLGVMPIN